MSNGVVRVDHVESVHYSMCITSTSSTTEVRGYASIGARHKCGIEQDGRRMQTCRLRKAMHTAFSNLSHNIALILNHYDNNHFSSQ